MIRYFPMMLRVSKTLLFCLFVLFFPFFLFSQDAEELQEIKDTIKTAVIEEGVLRKDLFDRAMSGRLLAEVDAFTDEILNSYINERLQQGGNVVPELHSFFFEFYPDVKKAAILGNLARFGVFNELSEDLLVHLQDRLKEYNTESGTLIKENILFAVESYKGLHLYTVPNNGSSEKKWDRIFSHLWKAYTIRPLQTNTKVLQEAARKAGHRRELFETTAYDYYDKSDPNFWRRLRLFFIYLFTPEKEGGIRKELEKVRLKLQRDIIAEVERGTPDNLPRLEAARLYSLEDDREVIFSGTDKSSPVYGEQIIMPFFSTSCPHCIVELQAIEEIWDNSLETVSETAITVAAVNTNLPGKEIFKEEMDEFTARTGVNMDFYSNIVDMNSLMLDFDVETVPLLLLFDERGIPLARVQFQHLGHIKMKLEWVLEEYLNVVL